MSIQMPVFDAPFAPDEETVVGALLGDAARWGHDEEAARRRARRLIEGIRARAGGLGGVEDFLREFGLSSREGLALMVLAEALLRVPDAETQDRLIEDKIGAGNWAEQEGSKDRLLTAASAWALGVSARIIRPGETPEGVLHSLVKRVGAPTVRTMTRQAMRFLGRHFVLGETIGDALSRARGFEKKGYRHSYDMLGEGARTAADAKRYFEAYADAIEKIGSQAGGKALPDRPGISVKLSALHPRYEPLKRERILKELVPRVADLANRARRHQLNFTVDAEEAERLELSLDVIKAVIAQEDFSNWEGFGLAVQAYQKRALAVIDYVDALARTAGIRMMVRLVKGAYWDTEIKNAQVAGLDDFPVFTRKPATDLSYLAAARSLLARRERLYPQFATHNALTVATILEMAGNDRSGFEFQRLHGMGESLYESMAEDEAAGVPCRIYAPVGGYRDLLAYLVRRLLENGANSSFVARVGDESVPVEQLLVRPQDELRGKPIRNTRIDRGNALFGRRANSKGLEFGERAGLNAFLRERDRADLSHLQAREASVGRSGEEVASPIDGTRIGTVYPLSPDDARKLVEMAEGHVAAVSKIPAAERAAALRRTADLMEARRAFLMAILAREGGKTIDDALAEVREAIDFCRFYADEAERLFAEPAVLPGPTGEDNRLVYRSRGVVVAISPWNFPLAIFCGQIAAALAAGNVVIAKPAEQTPLIAATAVALMKEAGIASQALHLAPGDGRTGAALVEHPATVAVAFTGSTETAFAINRALAARNAPIAPLIAETGGINGLIVDATALPEQVADDVILSAFRSAGQRCSALRLLYVQEDVADRMIEMIAGAARELSIGDPCNVATDIGPVIDAAQLEMLAGHVAEMKARHRIRFAGDLPPDLPPHGHWIAPHIIEIDRPEALDREVFGPILHIVRWKAGELGKVCETIERTGYGLTLGVHSRVDAVARFVTERMTTGNIYVNRNMIGAIVGSQPFGGSGLSGTGPKAGGPNYVARFAREQVISTNTAAAGGNASLIGTKE